VELWLLSTAAGHVWVSLRMQVVCTAARVTDRQRQSTDRGSRWPRLRWPRLTITPRRA